MKKIIFSVFILLTYSLSLYSQQVISISTATLKSIDVNSLKENIKILASDEFEGRGVASKGEDLTINYISKQFESLGLKPAGENGGYFQKVPLVGMTPDEKSIICEFSADGNKLPLQYRKDYVLWTKRVTPNINVADKDVIFAGYGIVAPEYNWNDFKNIDVKDKIVLVLVNDPQIPDSKDPTQLDNTMFEGKAMTYYGRWTYKFEEAARQKCAGALVIHEDGPAGYKWNVVESSNTGELFSLEAENNNMDRAFFEGWITYDTAKKLTNMAGYNIEDLKQKALQKNFQPVNLHTKANVNFDNAIKKVQSNNVAGLLEGRDNKLKNEYVLYMAHWDHFGIGTPKNGDAIYNGATDNAMGVSALFELAKAFNMSENGPSRSVVFLSVTAEEQGLLGSQHYAEHPLFPLNKTLAVINMDGLNTFGKTKDITIVGYGKSTMDEYAENAAKMQGRIISKDPETEKGFYYRSDHFNMAKKGVPALDPDQGTIYIDKSEDYGMQRREWYNENIYHTPFDEYDESWDLTGAIEDLQLLFTVGYMLTETNVWPVWKEGSEFKAIREASLKESM